MVNPGPGELKDPRLKWRVMMAALIIVSLLQLASGQDVRAVLAAMFALFAQQESLRSRRFPDD